MKVIRYIILGLAIISTSCQLSVSKNEINSIIDSNFTIENINFGGFAPTEYSYKFKRVNDEIRVKVTWENMIPKEIDEFTISLREFEIIKQQILCLIEPNEIAKAGKLPSYFYSDYIIKSRFKKML